MMRSFYRNKVLSFSFIVAMLMVTTEVAPIIGVFCLTLMFWKWGVEKYDWKPLSKRWTGILSVLALGQVLIQFRTLIGQEPAYTFLLALSALRVMDYRTERDHKFIVLLGFLLIAIKSLFSLDIYWIMPSAAAFAGLWYSLFPEVYPRRARLLIKMFILSLPFAFVMFFAFPRFVLPWAMSRGAGAYHGEVGFSDELSPGRVAEIANTNVMAFRARLEHIPLAVTSDLYWRGSVLTASKGLSWGPGKPGITALPSAETEWLPTYDVAIEATSERFIFSLEGTRAIRSDFATIVGLDRDIFRSSRPLTKASVYVGYWDRDYVDREAPTDQDLQTPPLREKTGRWIEGVLNKKLDAKGKLAEIKKLFSEKGFVYTISPGTYGPNDLDTFLFERKKGFCEHYAGAYASLARGLGVPARVVIGYQGGKYNPWGDFWKISQRDAHAWAEVYLDEKWERVDPTSWVAPLRLSIGAEDFFNLSEEEQQTFAKSANWRPTWEGPIAVWDQIVFWAEDLNYQWTYFLIDFDRGNQRNFWQNLLQQKGPVVLFCIVFALFIYVALRGRFGGKKGLSADQKLIRDVEAWAVGKKHFRSPEEPPLSYLNRLAQEFPNLKIILGKIGHNYDRIQYAGGHTSQASELSVEWKREIKKGPR